MLTKLGQPGTDTDGVQEMLSIGLIIDQAARVLLEYVFQQAALSATDEKTLVWLESAMGISESYDVQVINDILEIYPVKMKAR